MAIKVPRYDNNDIKQASSVALWSLLNLTFAPVVAFIILLTKRHQFSHASLSHYHLGFAIKLNLIAAIALIAISMMMIALGGLDSGWTWVFVITYFIFVHTVFIMIAVWMLVRAWAGHKMGIKLQ